MKALFLTKYSPRGASSRYRTLQYFPYLEAQGWTICWQPFLSEAYLDRLFNRGERSMIEGLGALLRRVKYIHASDLSRFDVIYVEDEVLPRVPSWLESLLFTAREKLVVDYDDAVFVPYQSNVLLRNKISAEVRSAAEVIVGNEFLRSYASRFTSRVNVIPTVIDLRRYEPKGSYDRGDARHVVIGWIGTPATARHLASFAPVLQKLSRRHSILLRSVGTLPGFHIPGIAVQNLPWSEETEAQIIRTFDLGVMPLIDEPFVRGKCGLKLIQYMGCAVPSVGHDIGANAEIIQDGVNGFLASSGDEYIEKLERLISDREVRARLGQAGRKTVETRYALQVHASRFCGVLTKVAQGCAIPECLPAGCRVNGVES